MDHKFPKLLHYKFLVIFRKNKIINNKSVPTTWRWCRRTPHKNCPHSAHNLTRTFPSWSSTQPTHMSETATSGVRVNNHYMVLPYNTAPDSRTSAWPLWFGWCTRATPEHRWRVRRNDAGRMGSLKYPIRFLILSKYSLLLHGLMRDNCWF